MVTSETAGRSNQRCSLVLGSRDNGERSLLSYATFAGYFKKMSTDLAIRKRWLTFDSWFSSRICIDPRSPIHGVGDGRASPTALVVIYFSTALSFGWLRSTGRRRPVLLRVVVIAFYCRTSSSVDWLWLTTLWSRAAL